MVSSDNIGPRHSHFRLFTVILTVLGSLGAAGAAVATAAIVVNKYKEKVDLLENALSAVSSRISGLEQREPSEINTATGRDGRNVELRANSTDIEWRHQGDASWKRLVSLESLRGPKGAKGDDGVAASFSTADIDRFDALISQRVSEKIAEIAKFSATPVSPSVSDAFDTSGCIPAESLRGKTTFVLQKGMEFCAEDGRVLFRVADISKYGKVYFSNPGRNDGVCAFEKKCTFSSINATYIFERKATDENGVKALFRLSED
jgi:hypothetical protein